MEHNELYNIVANKEYDINFLTFTYKDSIDIGIGDIDYDFYLDRKKTQMTNACLNKIKEYLIHEKTEKEIIITFSLPYIYDSKIRDLETEISSLRNLNIRLKRLNTPLHLKSVNYIKGL